MTTVAVCGASLAGLTAAETLRRLGYGDHLVVLDPSPTLPPDRPPLSKQVLAGEWSAEQAAPSFAGRLDQLDLDLRLGTAATGLDAATRTLTLSDGSILDADGIVIATGASPRRLPGEMPDGVHVLRTLEDSLALRGDLDAGPGRVVVVGAGFIGAEVAATCRGRGHEVTMLEAAPALLSRVLPAEVGVCLGDLHRSHGVDLRLGVGVDRLVAGEDGRVREVVLADGSSIDADVVVVGIGVVPNDAWLEGSGLDLDDGVRTDPTCLAAPGIVAAGDVASWPNHRFGQVMRVEQWQHAVEQGEHAAARLFAELGGADPGPDFTPVPWFWSDQYDRKIQMAGRPSGTDTVEVVEGALDEERVAVLFRDGDRCTGVLGINRPRHVMQVRMKMSESLDWEPIRELFA